MSGLPWFPCYPEKLLGALAGMKPTVGYVYTIVLLRIYECGGACPDTLDALSTRTRFNKRIVSDALNELFQAGRLSRAVDGIRNPKADETIASQQGLRERYQTAGQKGGFAKAKKHKEKQTNEPSQATFSLELGCSKEHLERERDNNPEAYASGADAPTDDPRQRLFDVGRRTLERIAGMGEDSARALIGRWLRDVGDDATEVLGAIEDAERNRAIHPRSYITKILQNARGGGNGKTNPAANGSASVAGKRIAEQLRAGELSLPRRPARPSILHGPSDTAVRLISTRSSERS